jgi:hypothetical protein
MTKMPPSAMMSGEPDVTSRTSATDFRVGMQKPVLIRVVPERTATDAHLQCGCAAVPVWYCFRHSTFANSRGDVSDE